MENPHKHPVRLSRPPTWLGLSSRPSVPSTQDKWSSRFESRRSDRIIVALFGTRENSGCAAASVIMVAIAVDGSREILELGKGDRWWRSCNAGARGMPNV